MPLGKRPSLAILPGATAGRREFHVRRNSHIIGSWNSGAEPRQSWYLPSDLQLAGSSTRSQGGKKGRPPFLLNDTSVIYRGVKGYRWPCNKLKSGPWKGYSCPWNGIKYDNVLTDLNNWQYNLCVFTCWKCVVIWYPTDCWYLDNGAVETFGQSDEAMNCWLNQDAKSPSIRGSKKKSQSKKRLSKWKEQRQ